MDKLFTAGSITYNDITICLNDRRVFVKDAEIALKRREFDILQYLIENKNIVLTYEQIYRRIWGGEYIDGSNNILCCQMHRLTAKINPAISTKKYIVNVRDFGYQMNPDLFERLSNDGKTNALLRKDNDYNLSMNITPGVVSFSDILMHLSSRKVFIKDQEVSLTRREFDILKSILESKGDILSYEQLYKLVWGEKHDYNSNKALMLQVHRLKGKIQIDEDSPEYIQNIREIGYRLNT